MELGQLAQQLPGALIAQLGRLDDDFHNLVAALIACAELNTPFSRRRNFWPFCVPCGIFSSVRPSMVGTSILAPSPASETATGTVISMLSPSRWKNGCGSTRVVM